MASSSTEKKLRALFKEDPQAAAFFSWIATYTNAASEMSVTLTEKKVSQWAAENWHDDLTVTRRDIIRVMKALENLGVGQFWNGRRGADSRFEFLAHRADIGQVAMGKMKTLKIEEDVEDIHPDELIEMHRRLIAQALETTVSSVRIKIQED